MQNNVMRKVDFKAAPWSMHEFFAGSGLVAYGLKDIFQPVWSNDNCPKKAEIYKSNFDAQHFVLDDIANVSGSDLPFAHLSWASFPCQDLSLAGAMGGINARRSGLVWEWLRILDEMPQRPSLLVVENVTGLLSAKSGEYYIELHKALSSLGYKSGAFVINASCFVPQSRPRVFILAVKKEVEIPRKLQSSGPNWLHSKAAITVSENLADWIWWNAEKPPKRQVHLSDVIDWSLPYDRDAILNLMPQKHKEKLFSYDEKIVTGYRRTRNGKQVLELRFDGLAGCLRTPEGGSSKQFVIVKDKKNIHARFLSSREAARLMGAPESYILPKVSNDGYKAMGDAVALPVAKFVGESFLEPLARMIYDDCND